MTKTVQLSLYIVVVADDAVAGINTLLSPIPVLSEQHPSRVPPRNGEGKCA